ncbi:PREDICTED: probable serine/threonine-protein kinase nek3 isoform X1 [Theobroma cacao]|uniref:Probable serine/threonine-protein kinase nek3 isoform X1 n=1 Tax=Theobroma cacao TaxID=3641 RepID=A0AB32W6E1_THECC|nr:PREDICTED: probable serine/threonine-protein kinase nek3 isoform X1 [Theobroma cacao]
MMNRNLRESLVGGGRNNINVSAASHHHRRGQSLTGGLFPRDSDENLDLFSKNRRSLSVASSDESSDVAVKLGRLSLGSARVGKGGLDDLLSSTDGGKHDYDWLLTPPGTPLFSSSEGSESQSTSLAPRSNSKVRSVSTTKTSRLSVSQSESNHSTRPTRSSSVTRPSLSSSYSTYSSNRGPSILNTSSVSVSSYTRPSSPITRSRPSTPSARSTPSRASTPSKVRPSSTSSYIDKSRPSQSSRPSTPSSRPQIPANLNSTAVRSNSRPSTPTRRNPIPSLSSAAAGASPSAGRTLSNGRSAAPASRPSSPGPRVRPPQQPVVPPDFPLDTPPNLRTTLPDRPVSAGRSRPGVSVGMKANQDTTSSVNMPRRHSSPIVTRGRLTEPPGRTRVHSNGHASDIHESRKTSHVNDSAMRKPVKSSTTTADSAGFGRTISKKSLDMAIRHMDIRNGTGSIRSLSGTTLFPQSIRSATTRTQSLRSFSTSDSVNSNGSPGSLQNGDFSENGNSISRPVQNGSDSHNGRYSAKFSEVDIYESSRYDAILLKEDLKNTNWLHSIDDKSDPGSIFENGFEPLPEPFGPL